MKLGSQKSPRSRRQRTTSLNQTSQKTAAESIIRTQHRTIYTAGRPPWYNTEGQKVEPFVIGEQLSFKIIYLINRNGFINEQNYVQTKFKFLHFSQKQEPKFCKHGALL